MEKLNDELIEKVAGGYGTEVDGCWRSPNGKHVVIDCSVTPNGSVIGTCMYCHREVVVSTL